MQDKPIFLGDGTIVQKERQRERRERERERERESEGGEDPE